MGISRQYVIKILPQLTPSHEGVILAWLRGRASRASRSASGGATTNHSCYESPALVGLLGTSRCVSSVYVDVFIKNPVERRIIIQTMALADCGINHAVGYFTKNRTTAILSAFLHSSLIRSPIRSVNYIQTSIPMYGLGVHPDSGFASKTIRLPKALQMWPVPPQSA
jgi:hypothetical protein